MSARDVVRVFEATAAEVLVDAFEQIWGIYLVGLALVALTAIADRLARGASGSAPVERPEEPPAVAGRVGPRGRTRDRNRRRAA